MLLLFINFCNEKIHKIHFIVNFSLKDCYFNYYSASVSHNIRYQKPKSRGFFFLPYKSQLYKISFTFTFFFFFDKPYCFFLFRCRRMQLCSAESFANLFASNTAGAHNG